MKCYNVTMLEPQIKSENSKESVHQILAQSYSVFFLVFLLGIILDLLWPIRIIPKYIFNPAGIILIIAGPLLIMWAQHTSGSFIKKHPKPTAEDFKSGPYAFTRGPTHAGITMLLVGFGFIMNSPYLIALSLVASVVSRRIFLRKQENLLSKVYGEEYEQYKREVSSWF